MSNCEITFNAYVSKLLQAKAHYQSVYEQIDDDDFSNLSLLEDFNEACREVDLWNAVLSDFILDNLHHISFN